MFALAEQGEEVSLYQVYKYKSGRQNQMLRPYSSKEEILSQTL